VSPLLPFLSSSLFPFFSPPSLFSWYTCSTTNQRKHSRKDSATTWRVSLVLITPVRTFLVSEYMLTSRVLRGVRVWNMNLFINVFFSNAESKMSSILVASKLWQEVSCSSMPRRFNEINLFPTSPTLYNSYNIIQTFVDLSS